MDLRTHFGAHMKLFQGCFAPEGTIRRFVIFRTRYFRKTMVAIFTKSHIVTKPPKQAHLCQLKAPKRDGNFHDPLILFLPVYINTSSRPRLQRSEHFRRAHALASQRFHRFDACRNLSVLHANMNGVAGNQVCRILYGVLGVVGDKAVGAGQPL